MSYKQATLHNTTIGDRLIADDNFTCIPGNGEVIVGSDGRLFVPCDHGKHYLEGQLNNQREYVGFMIVVEEGA